MGACAAPRGLVGVHLQVHAVPCIGADGHVGAAAAARGCTRTHAGQREEGGAGGAAVSDRGGSGSGRQSGSQPSVLGWLGRARRSAEAGSCALASASALRGGRHCGAPPLALRAPSPVGVPGMSEGRGGARSCGLGGGPITSACALRASVAMVLRLWAVCGGG